MKKNILVLFLPLVLVAASLEAYTVEITASEGISAAWDWGLAPDARSGFSPRGHFLGQLGFPLPLGKLHVLAEGDVGMELGVLGGAGWGGEWYLTPWFSLEAAALVKAGWFMTWFSREPTQFVYGGVEPLFRANLLLFDGLVVLGVSSSPSVRWLQETAVVTSVPACATLGFRF